MQSPRSGWNGSSRWRGEAGPGERAAGVDLVCDNNIAEMFTVRSGNPRCRRNSRTWRRWRSGRGCEQAQRPGRRNREGENEHGVQQGAIFPEYFSIRPRYAHHSDRYEVADEQRVAAHCRWWANRASLGAYPLRGFGLDVDGGWTNNVTHILRCGRLGARLCGKWWGGFAADGLRSDPETELLTGMWRVRIPFR